MADKRKLKKRIKEELVPGSKIEPEKPSKEEYAVAKWLRSNVPNKKTKFLNYSVEYFTAVKAVDALMESHWAKEGKSGEEPMFTCREDVVDFLERMLTHKFFHRAKKVVVSEQELKGKQKKKDKKLDVKEEKDENRKEKKTVEEAESSHAEGCKEEKCLEEKSQRKKRKIRLEMHMDQMFVDGLDAYVWLYDPIPFYYWVFGALVVLGAIGICVFPLWPPAVRKGVYYLSVAAAGVLVFILALAILRVIVFCIIWTLSLGRHHFWLLPNLVEDVGFLASFWPLYHYEYRGSDYDANKLKKKKNKKKKDKDSDAEEDAEGESKRGVDTGAEETGAEDEKDMDKNIERHTSDVGGKDTESESESSQKSTTGRDFEMVEKEDAEDSSS
ncbi:translocation protein SEC62 isoform X1 [Thrips palmi]|uniref:Translocation protein SEC62 n=1 Tax=Thrips palmi TaxID=161013 RepID=A0A6P8YYW1_THRPL|nr:translocation protein SEC62 isoform X1 [Thrips palmi]